MAAWARRYTKFFYDQAKCEWPQLWEEAGPRLFRRVTAMPAHRGEPEFDRRSSGRGPGLARGRPFFRIRSQGGPFVGKLNRGRSLHAFMTSLHAEIVLRE